MALLLVYAVTLLAAVLISDRAQRTVLSTAVLFLVVGAAYGSLHGAVSSDAVRVLAEIALVAVLFTDSMRTSLPDLRRAWRLPGRALLLGFPLTLGGTALAARALVGLGWPQALLVGAALAPTDPVLASAIVGREEIPGRLRDLLSVESGLNDGLALPFLVAFIAWAGHEPVAALAVGGELAIGVAIGLAIPWAAVRLERTAVFGASEQYRRIGIVAVALVTYAVAAIAHGNTFLAAFAAGATLATIAPRARDVFAQIGDSATEMLKLAALLVFGSMLSLHALGALGWRAWAFAVVALVAVRPLAISIALIGSGMSFAEKLVAAWFGPKGFGSVVYGLLILSSGVTRGESLFHLIAITTALSIVLHSSSDVPVAHWFERKAGSGTCTNFAEPRPPKLQGDSGTCTNFAEPRPPKLQGDSGTCTNFAEPRPPKLPRNS